MCLIARSHTRMKGRSTEGSQNGTENSRHAMETHQQGPVPDSEEMAHVLPSLPRASTLTYLFIQTWKDGDLKGKSGLADIKSVGSSTMSRQASPGLLYPNGNWGWQDVSHWWHQVQKTPPFTLSKQLSKAGSKAVKHLPPSPPDTQAGVCSTRGTAASWGQTEKATPIHQLKDSVSFSNHNWAGLHSLNEEVSPSNYRQKRDWFSQSCSLIMGRSPHLKFYFPSPSGRETPTCTHWQSQCLSLTFSFSRGNMKTVFAGSASTKQILNVVPSLSQILCVNWSWAMTWARQRDEPQAYSPNMELLEQIQRRSWGW